MRIAIRADAGHQMGTGHMMRCLALAQAARDEGWEVTFMTAHNEAVLDKRLQAEGMEVVSLPSEAGSMDDAKETVNFARKMNVQFLVVDGYQFNAAYQQVIRDSGLSFLLIDDFGQARRYEADVILNQNVYADKKFYTDRLPETRLLLGTCYALLRREFRSWKNWKRKIPRFATRILVTLGGSDPEHATLQVVKALKDIKTGPWEAIVVVGPGNRDEEILKKACEKSKFSIEIEKNPTKMPDLMAWADVAIAGAGSTSWELAFMGLPSLLLIMADDQKINTETLEQRGAAINLGWHETVATSDITRALESLLASSDVREKMSREGKKIVDGEGARRVLECLRVK